MLVHALDLLSAMQTSLYIRIQIFQDIHLLVRPTRNRKNLERRTFMENIMSTNLQTLGRRGGKEEIRLAGPADTCLF